MVNETENFITVEEKENLEKELKTLKGVKRSEVIEELRTARSYGDLSENAEYDTARKKQGVIESRISEIENTLKVSEVVEEDHNIDTVTIGNSVEVEVKGEGKKVYDIGTEGEGIEASSHSPIAEALLGKQEGNTVVVALPRGEVEMTIKKIR